ncbi:unnamed protein product [Effrenium voratum]|uniref:Uncharacterized protein n=1 Tax=Effrenium voratum TaxID=2562239 RepID=A0AA36J0Y4_9DINO|nr:unnamed protein product [Effrenium voratum]
MALPLFGLLWGQLQVAHVLKDVRGDLSTLRLLPSIALLSSAPLVLLPKQASRWLPVAAFANGLYLLVHGSRSNHILQDILVNLTIVLAAWGGAFEKNLANALRWYLVVLYAISALHKMNSDWFDPRVSCAASVSATMLAQYVPSLVPPGSSLCRLILQQAPHGAAVFEVLLPAVLLLAGPPGSRSPWQGACARFGVVLGAIFHLMLALPLPPASFYPFSASCLALYPPDAVAGLAAICPSGLAQAFWLMLPGLSLSLCAAANVSGAWSSWLKGGTFAPPFEYPPYDLYNAGVCWCFGVTALLLLLALLGPGASTARAKGSFGLASIVVIAAALWLGLGPYLGTRTYPAFAMFSNLRVEAAPNHFFLGADVLGLQTDVVQVLETNSSALLNYQVDLSQLYTPQTSEYFRAAGLEQALWICPPAWQRPESNFRVFSAPAVGLWQRLRSESETGTLYARVRRGGEELLVTRREQLRGRCRDRIPTWLCDLAHTWLGPFRSFEEDQSVCRH